MTTSSSGTLPSRAARLATLASYVSPFILHRLVIDPTPPLAPVVERFPAAVLFADIAGFTTLAERLAQHGPAGAEELTALLNRDFGQLIDIVTAHGGDVVKFAGDGLLACWSVMATDEDLSTVTCRAAQCSLAVQAALHNYEVTRDTRLALRVSIGAGDVSVAYIGGVFDRWEILVVGKPLVQVGQAEHYASPGEVLLTPGAWELLRDRCVGQPLPTGYARLDAVHTPLPVQPALLPTLIPAMETTLEEYIPAAIVTRLRAGHSEWLGELRRVTVLFVNLPDLDYLTPLTQAQTLIRALQTALYRYEGSLNKLSIDDKGVTFVAALGLPPLAHEDDAVRGVQAAHAMQAALQGLGVRSAIGITTGRVFCGAIGNTTRREYTIMGDVVNLAARLMQAASEDILCDSATYQAAQRRFTFVALPPRHVKGKAEPVLLYRPLGPVASTIASARMLIGRKSERHCLTDRLQALLHRGEGGLVIIEGEAGIGKSHLVDDLYYQAHAVGANILMGAGNAIDQTTPYYPWQAIFLRLFHVEAYANDPEFLWTQVCTHLPADPEMEDCAPLLNAVLPVQIPDTDLTAHLTTPVRAERTHALLARLLHTAARHTPTLLLLEDVHWFDSVSWTLLATVCRDVPSALIVITTRPFAEPIPKDYQQLHKTCMAQKLSLTPLSLEDTVALVCQRLGVTALPVPVSDLIYEKTAGHPFFSEELAYALRDAGVIRVAEGTCQVVPGAGNFRTIPFPETLEGIITSRFDRLPPVHQLLLKIASVSGPVVPAFLLQAINPLALDAAHMADSLAALCQRGFLLLGHDGTEGVYYFKHALMHEVVYNLLPLAQRRPLHRAVAEWYERTHADNLALFYPLLAHHYTEAGLQEQAIAYWQRAGQHALERSANREALSHFTRGLELLYALPATPERVQQELTLQLAMGTSLLITKGHTAPEVEHTYKRTYELAQTLGDTLQHFAVLVGLWRFYFSKARLHMARDLAQQCFTLAQHLEDPSALQEAHQILGSTIFFMGDHVAAHAHLRQGIAHYNRQHSHGLAFSRGTDPGVVCFARASWALWWLGYPDQARAQAHEAITLAQRLSHPYTLSLALHYNAVLHVWNREMAVAHEQLEVSIALMQKHGFVHFLGQAITKLGWVLVEQGVLEAGMAKIHEGIEALRIQNIELGRTTDLAILAQAYGRTQRPAEGLRVLEEAFTLAHDHAESFYEAELYRLKGELLCQAAVEARISQDCPARASPGVPRVEAAEACFHQAMTLAHQQGARALELRAVLSLSRYWQHQGQRAAARQMLAGIYHWFTEGFATPDLQEAKTLIEVLQ